MSTPWLLRKQTRVIDGVSFEVGLLNVATGRAVLVRLTHLVGGGLAAALKGGSLAAADVGGLVSGLLERLNTEDLAWLHEQFASVTNVTHSDGRKQPLGQEGVADELFAGRYLLMFQWLQFCVEVNFADFFAKARLALGALDASPPTTGQ